MKITSASKKVLASALSAAMVVAFAPTVAFGAETAALTEDQAKALGYTVKSVQVVNGASGSEVKTFYYKDLQEAFDSGAVICDGTSASHNSGNHAAGKVDAVNAVKLGLTLMADQDGNFVTNNGAAAANSTTGAIISGAADTISIETAGYKITNSKNEDVAPLTVSALDTVTVTGTGTIEQVKADAADGAEANVKAITGGGNVVLKGVTVTTASKKTAAVDTVGTKLEGATIASAVSGVSEIKGGTYGAIAGAEIDVYGTVTTGAITGNVDVQSGADLSVTVQNTKNGQQLVGISNGVDFETIASNKTSKVSVSVINNGSTVAGEMKKYADTDTAPENNFKCYELADGKYTATTKSSGASLQGLYYLVAGKDATAVGINGAVTGLAKNATLEVVAKANGYDADKALGNVFQAGGTTADAADIDPVTNAIAIGSITGNVEDGALSASAVSIDGIAKGISTGGLTVKGGTVAVSAEGYDATDTKSIAVVGTLEASTGKFVGNYTAGTDKLTGGSYSVKPTVAAYNEANYVVVDDGEFFTIEQAKNFTINTTAAYNKLIADGTATDIAITDVCVENILQDLSAGKTVSNLVLAEGVKTSDILAKAVDGKLYVNFTKVGYNAKRATDEQKAAYEALKAYATENLSLIENANGEATIEFYELSLGYLEKDGTYTKMAGINDLGTKIDGRDTVANAIQLRAEDHTKGEIISYSGSVAKMAYAVKDGKTQNYVETAAIPFATAYMTTDDEALKNAVIKGEDTPVTPAPEKATQGIDVAKKSMTVKLGKKSKTSKSKTFSMGASAETKLTTSKKSGSKYITVSGNKVALKKGVKKGTYTAKVSLKAASSDEFLAAAKTVTVKFVVKK